ncbi:adenine phosphoribosyltransferases [Candidatus Termititenax dinenymphae]|uniref:adenine phosphoribosyltransferase n=1 Tax=Candidatus Termititenax dinenymphae TaxID=2218523 RepID=A0A388TJB8_9BACT|nr:adenine phosphoribosyltransferases [Candidatus Termititenax dinenymphae]
MLQKIDQAITSFPDFPVKGVIFRDLNPIYKKPELLKGLVQEFAKAAQKLGKYDYIAGIEARGFILATALAYELNCAFIPVRKKGKLPGKLHTVTYQLEYGEDTLEIQEDANLQNAKVLAVDDVFATGGTMRGVLELLRKCGADPHFGVIMDIKLTDRQTLGVPNFALF